MRQVFGRLSTLKQSQAVNLKLGGRCKATMQHIFCLLPSSKRKQAVYACMFLSHAAKGLYCFCAHSLVCIAPGQDVNPVPWLLQALKELALDYENDNANVAVPIMYDDETAYLCDQGGK